MFKIGETTDDTHPRKNKNENTDRTILFVSIEITILRGFFLVPPNTKRQSNVRRQGARALATYQAITHLIGRYPGVRGQIEPWLGKTTSS